MGRDWRDCDRKGVCPVSTKDLKTDKHPGICDGCNYYRDSPDAWARKQVEMYGGG